MPSSLVRRSARVPSLSVRPDRQAFRAKRRHLTYTSAELIDGIAGAPVMHAAVPRVGATVVKAAELVCGRKTNPRQRPGGTRKSGGRADCECMHNVCHEFLALLKALSHCARLRTSTYGIRAYARASTCAMRKRLCLSPLPPPSAAGREGG
jgi:hypothetical protein